MFTQNNQKTNFFQQREIDGLKYLLGNFQWLIIKILRATDEKLWTILYFIQSFQILTVFMSMFVTVLVSMSMSIAVVVIVIIVVAS